jgi:replication-associated recombination protein RarA
MFTLLLCSDADAALYWLGRMLQGGEDPLYIARRLVRAASEDIGLADNTALPLVRIMLATAENVFDLNAQFWFLGGQCLPGL